MLAPLGAKSPGWLVECTMSSKYLELSLFLVIMAVIMPQPAHAYLDPSSGAYLIQAIIAGVLGGVFFLRTQISAFFAKFAKKEKPAEKPETSD